MLGEIIVAGITTSGLIIVAFVNRGQLKRIKADTKATKEQVQNSHRTNLREDMDKLADGIKRIEHRQSRADTKLDTVVAKHDLVAIQAQVEHARLWDAITGGDPPMPETTETEILEVQQQKEEES